MPNKVLLGCDSPHSSLSSSLVCCHNWCEEEQTRTTYGGTGYKVYKDKAFSQEVRLLACS
eukprot:137556-Pelagomonas_calceolata.AAC.3